MILYFLSKIFAFFVNIRNNYFDISENRQKKLIFKSEIPVISVGNLSVGGTGKTPFVIELCKIIKEIGHFPCVIGKGYKRESKADIIVSDGNQIFVNAKIGGDEMILIAQKAKIPVVAGKSKSKTAISIPNIFGKNPKIDCIIVDDGFQHRKLHRDLDIVLLDLQTFQNPFLLPKGRLREPFSSLKRADIICLTKGANMNNLLQIFSENKKLDSNILHKKTIIEADFDLENPYFLLASKENIKEKEIISEISKIIIATGIANPQNFVNMLKNKDFEIIYSKKFSDHHNFTTSDINYLCDICDKNDCRNLCITEKDAVKFHEFKHIFELNDINILVFPLYFSIKNGKQELIDNIKKML